MSFVLWHFYFSKVGCHYIFKPECNRDLRTAGISLCFAWIAAYFFKPFITFRFASLCVCAFMYSIQFCKWSLCDFHLLFSGTKFETTLLSQLVCDNNLFLSVAEVLIFFLRRGLFDSREIERGRNKASKS